MDDVEADWVQRVEDCDQNDLLGRLAQCRFRSYCRRTKSRKFDTFEYAKKDEGKEEILHSRHMKCVKGYLLICWLFEKLKYACRPRMKIGWTWN